MKSLSLFLFFVVFAAIVGTGKVKNAFATRSKDPAQVEISVVDEAEARSLFQKFANDKEIPFKYPVDGCYARATEMTHDAEKENIMMARIYAEGRLQITTKLPQYPEVRWGYHVAPAIYVRQKDGKDLLMVFDPSMFDRPVTVQEWTKKMETPLDGVPGRIDNVYYGSRFQYFTREDESNATEWNRWNLQNAAEIMKEYKHYEDHSIPHQGKDSSRKGIHSQDLKGTR